MKLSRRIRRAWTVFRADEEALIYTSAGRRIPILKSRQVCSDRRHDIEDYIGWVVFHSEFDFDSIAKDVQLSQAVILDHKDKRTGVVKDRVVEFRVEPQYQRKKYL